MLVNSSSSLAFLDHSCANRSFANSFFSACMDILDGHAERKGMSALSRKEVAEMLGVHVNTIRYWCDPKRSNYDPNFPKPFTRDGKHNKWRPEDIERYMSKGRAA